MTDFEKLNSMKSSTVDLTGQKSASFSADAPKKKNKTALKIFSFLLAGILLFTLGFSASALIEMNRPKAAVSIPNVNPPKLNVATTVGELSGNNKIVDIVKEVGPSVVNINIKVPMRDFFNNLFLAEGAGSGVIIAQDSTYVYIMTNAHVVKNAKELVVSFADGTEALAQVKGVDSQTDLAVIQIEKSALSAKTNIKVAVLSDSDQIQVGETAIAIGNALGYNNTVTVGVVSALNRELQVDQNRTFSLIQTDAAINPGNSGGALVNIKGEVIGINTVKITETNVEGFGFAIPSNSAKPIIQALLEKGFVERPYLGIRGGDVTEAAAQLYDLPIGIYVAAVEPNSPAAAAGLLEKDIIVGFNGKTTYKMEDLKAQLATMKIGQKIEMKVLREGQKLTLSVTIQSRGDGPY